MPRGSVRALFPVMMVVTWQSEHSGEPIRAMVAMLLGHVNAGPIIVGLGRSACERRAHDEDCDERGRE